ncbi:50S ribosomal protein L10 [Chloroflexota bacterium]
MSREKKAEIIDSLEETFSRCTSAIFTDYRGLTTSEVTALRRRLQETGGEYRIVKNTLARFAAERAGKENWDTAFEGPVAIAFGYNEITEPAKIVAGYIRDSRIEMDIKGGFLGDRLLTSSEVSTLSTLPPREELLAKVLGQMNSPITALANCLASPIRGLMGVLQAQIKQVEGE